MWSLVIFNNLSLYRSLFHRLLLVHICESIPPTYPYLVVSSWRNGYSDGLQNRSKRVRTPVALLRSLSGKYPRERYEPPYPPNYGLNSTTTVLFGEWLWH